MLGRNTLKLYELPARPKQPIKIYGLIVGNAQGEQIKAVVLYHHIDGMYSYCTIENSKEVIHLHCGTELKKYKDGYKVV